MWGYRSLGVCGKGASMSGLGGRRRAMGISVGRRAGIGSAAKSVFKRPFAYDLPLSREVSNVCNLTKGLEVRYLQNCISDFGPHPYLLGFLASSRGQIGGKGGAGFRANYGRIRNFSFSANSLRVPEHPCPASLNAI